MSKYFKESEFVCHCCKQGKVNPKLITLLDAIREKLQAPIIVLSGYRCEAHNKECGGAKFSQHMKGNAADIRTDKMPPHEFYAWLEEHFKIDGHGKYATFNHIDVRGSIARWVG